MSVQKSASPLSIFAGSVAALALAAGCSGQPQGGSAIPGSLPFAGGGESSSAVSMRPAATNAIAVTILAPTPASNGKAVVALGLELDGKAKSFAPVNIRTSKSSCTEKRGTFTCRVTMQTTPGSHWLTIDGYTAFIAGKKPPKTNPASTNGVPVNALRATTNLQIALASPVNGIAVTAIGAGISGDVKSGFTIDRSNGAGPSSFAIYAVDQTKPVVGPGTSSFTLKGSNAQFVLTTPDPNQFVVDASAVTTAASTTIVATARGMKCPKNCKLSFSIAATALGSPSPSPSPGTSPTASASPSPAPPSPSPSPSIAPTPSPAAIFVTYATAAGGVVAAFDELGHTKATGAFPNAGNATSIVYDSGNAWFYTVTGMPSTPVTSYELTGSQIPLSGSFTATPVSLAVEPSPDRLFVATHVGAGNDSIFAYDENGVLQTLSPGFASTLVAAGPNALTYDSNSKHLLFANSSSGKLEAYDLTGNAKTSLATPPTSACASCTPLAVTYDPSINWPYAIWTGTKPLLVWYLDSGSYDGSTSTGLTNPVGLASDPHDRFIYVVDGTSVLVYDEFGNLQHPAGAFAAPAGATAAQSITVVPPT
jgi:hypothetical protein